MHTWTEHYSSLLEQCRRDIANHYLVTLVDGPDVQVYQLKQPNADRMMSCTIVFAGDQIVIYGDWSPGRDGVVSAPGYDRSWFVANLNASYLAEKFLRKDWQEEYTVECLQSYLDDEDFGFSDEQRKEIEQRLKRGWESGHEYQDWLYNNDLSILEDEFPMAYDPVHLAQLVCIQEKFSELWWEWYDARKKEAEDESEQYV